MSLYCILYLMDSADPEVSLGELGIERKWGLITYLLGSTEEPDPGSIPGFLLADWEELASEAHRISATQVAEIARWLDSIDLEAVMDRFDPDAMIRAVVYDAELARSYPDEYRTELASDLARLRAFIGQASRSGSSIVRVIA